MSWQKLFLYMPEKCLFQENLVYAFKYHPKGVYIQSSFFPPLFLSSLYIIFPVYVLLLYIYPCLRFSLFFLFLLFCQFSFLKNSRMAKPCTEMVYTLLDVKNLAAVGFSAS